MAKLICPHCGVSLSWKLLRGKPLPGERKILPNRAVLVCPSCQGEMHPNLHPTHFWVYLAFVPMVVTFYLMIGSDDKEFWFAAMAAALVVALFVTTYIYFRFLRNVPRFSTTPMSFKLPFKWQ